MLKKISNYNIESEQSILGCLLVGNKIQQEDILSKLSDEDFYVADHKKIYMAITKTKDKGIDYVTISNELGEDVKFEYLVSLAESVPSTSNYQGYIDIIKNNSTLRFINSKLDNLKMDLEGTKDAIYMQKKIEEIFTEIGTKNIQNDVENVNSSVDEVFEKIKDTINGVYSNFGLATGFKMLDKVLFGLQKSNLIILAARPGVGKTAFAVDIIVYIAITLRKKVLFYSLEMSKSEIIQRAFSYISGVDNYKIRKADFQNGEFKSIERAKELLSNSGLYIDDTTGLNTNEMLLRARKMQLKRGLDLIIVDYLQYAEPYKKSGNKYQDVGQVSYDLKMIARRLNVPVLALAQLNRNIDKEDRQPTLADLKDSGEIEQNADIVLMLHQKGKEEEEIKLIDLIVAKFRNGVKRAIPFRYIGGLFKFEEITK